MNIYMPSHPDYIGFDIDEAVTNDHLTLHYGDVTVDLVREGDVLVMGEDRIPYCDAVARKIIEGTYSLYPMQKLFSAPLDSDLGMIKRLLPYKDKFEVRVGGDKRLYIYPKTLNDRFYIIFMG